MADQELVTKYQQEGYQHVHIRRDDPDFKYHKHYHPRQVTLHVLEGDLEVDIDGQKQSLHPGEKIDIQAERFHTTCTGPAGCVYIHAERDYHG